MNALWWWIDRWRKSSAFMDMTLEQQGAYRNLLDEAALRGGPLPNDERVLAKACGDARAWKRVGAIVMARFKLHDDGWHHETLDAVLTESIIRAARQKRYRQGKNAPAIAEIVNRDGCVCGICASAVEPDQAEIDHIIPIAKGGHATDVQNLQLAHPRCNQKKGASGPLRHATLSSVPGLLQHHFQRNTQRNTQNNTQRPPDPISGSKKEKEQEREETKSLSPPALSDPFVNDEITLRAGNFLRRYRDDLYPKHRNARYLGHEHRDYVAAVTLCQTWNDERLDKLAVCFLTTNHKFAAEGSRTVPQLRALASWLDGELATWERDHSSHG